MNSNLGPDEVDLTESGDVVSAMSAAIGRLRQLAAAAFDAGRPEAVEAEAASPVPTAGAVVNDSMCG